MLAFKIQWFLSFKTPSFITEYIFLSHFLNLRKKLLLSAQILEEKYLHSGRAGEWSFSQEGANFGKVASVWKPEARKLLLSVFPYQEFLDLHTLPRTGQSHRAVPYIFYKTVFTFPFSRSFRVAAGLKATSIIREQVNPFARKLCPACRVTCDGSVWSCLQSSRTYEITSNPVQARLYCFHSTLLLSYMGYASYLISLLLF